MPATAPTTSPASAGQSARLWPEWARRPGPWLPWAVAVVTALPFLPALRAKFLMLDDDFNFLKNQNYRGLGPAQLKWMFTGFQLGGVYQPLAWVTHALEYLVWGMNPAGYHLTNIILMSLTGAAFYFLAVRVLRLCLEPQSGQEPLLRWSAAFAALFFAIHPQRVEVVAWASNRSYVLPGLFYILALNAYFKAHGSRLASKNAQMAACAFYFALSLLSKSIAMTLPATLLIADWYPLKRLRRFDRQEIAPLIVEKIPLFVLAAASAYMAAKGRVVFGAMVPVAKFGIGQRLGEAFFGVVFYLEKTLLPIGLAPFYSLPPHLSPWDDLCLPRTVLALAITAAALALRKRHPWLLAAWLAHVVALSPMLGLSQYGLMLQIAADKWYYLASAVWGLVAGGALLWALQNPAFNRERLAQAAAAVLAALAVLSFFQTRTWHDTETVYLHNLAVEPDCYFCHNNLAVYYNDHGRYAEGLAHALASLRIKPDYTLALANGAISYENLGQIQAAWALARRGLEAAPDDSDAHFNLGYFFSRRGLLDEAIAETQKAEQLAPNQTKVHDNLGYFFSREGDFPEAAQEYRATLGIAPKEPTATRGLADAQAAVAAKTPVAQARKTTEAGYVAAAMKALQARRFDEAVSQFKGALAIDSLDAQSHYNLGFALVQKGDLPAAAEEFRRAAQLKPDFANAHFNLGFVLQSMGRLSEAEGHYREAARLNPKAANAFLNLGILLTTQRRLDEADRFCSEAVRLEPSMAGNAHCWRKSR